MNWQSFTIGDRKICLKSFGRSRLDRALSVCEGFGASLPLPRNEQENTDLNNIFESLRTYLVALGATDVETEGSWVDSNGDALTYFNWWNKPFAYYDYSIFHSGKWSGSSGDRILNVVCQKPDLTGKRIELKRC